MNLETLLAPQTTYRTMNASGALYTPLTNFAPFFNNYGSHSSEFLPITRDYQHENIFVSPDGVVKAYSDLIGNRIGIKTHERSMDHHPTTPYITSLGPLYDRDNL